MRVKGGGRKKSWEAMPVDDGGSGVLLFGHTAEPNDAAFAAPEHQEAEPQPQIEPERQNQEEAEGAEGEDGDGEGEGEDGEEGEEGEEAEVEDENKERSTKLDEGFYEIEAIRRKRVRKGQLQYLIKWRGWPETANTWEPLENLQSVSDVIDAFEESLRSGKQRKRKRKSGTPHTQPKKKQQQQLLRSTDTVTDEELSNAEKALSSNGISGSGVDGTPPPQQSLHSVGDGEVNGCANNTETAMNIDSGNSFASFPQQINERREENEYDPKLSELKATVSTNNISSDKLSVHFQEAKAPEVNGPTNGLSKVDSEDPVQSIRTTGAKKRKSGSVKRFKQEAPKDEVGAMQNVPTRVSTRYAGRVDQTEVGRLDYAGENSGRKNKIEESKEAVRITKILKPMGYSTSILNNVQDVSVTFLGMRSDGTEVIVDNKFLKVNDPLLLINFYEQHLRYSPAE
ncbi:chromo domain-containing protein LHP1 [Argentina anserina]|uniref:chromo domain-containing protein LHP1 n=1 Tax=Argentina anserina TaxID=57926 RepID=UPI0021763195|nr:chromo domain-containing protein LHP1 [Potentilla anserina]